MTDSPVALKFTATSPTVTSKAAAARNSDDNHVADWDFLHDLLNCYDINVACTHGVVWC